MEELYEYRRRLLEHFSAVAGDIENRLAALPPVTLRAPWNHAGKSRHWLVAHLRATEEHLFLRSIRCILAESRPTLDDFDRLAWMRANYDAQESIGRLLSTFAEIRNQELECVQNLLPDGWNRVGRHPVWGDRTLQWWIEKSLAHSVLHLRQLDTEEDLL